MDCNSDQTRLGKEGEEPLVITPFWPAETFAWGPRGSRDVMGLDLASPILEIEASRFLALLLLWARGSCDGRKPRSHCHDGAGGGGLPR